MNERISIAKLLNNPELYNEENFYGFWDWFCKDSTLKNHFKSLLLKNFTINGISNFIPFQI